MQRQDGGRSVHHAKILQDKSKGVVAAKLLHVEAENTCVQAKIYAHRCPALLSDCKSKLKTHRACSTQQRCMQRCKFCFECRSTFSSFEPVPTCNGSALFRPLGCPTGTGEDVSMLLTAELGTFTAHAWELGNRLA